MDDWWESEFGENGDQCAENLRGYQPPEITDGIGLYSILCGQCQLRHRCTVGVMVLRDSLVVELEARAFSAMEERDAEERVAYALNGLGDP